MPKSRGRKPKARKLVAAPEAKVAKPARVSMEEKKEQVLNKPDLAKPTLPETGVETSRAAPKQKWAALRKLFRRGRIDR